MFTSKTTRKYNEAFEEDQTEFQAKEKAQYINEKELEEALRQVENDELDSDEEAKVFLQSQALRQQKRRKRRRKQLEQTDEALTFHLFNEKKSIIEQFGTEKYGQKEKRDVVKAAEAERFFGHDARMHDRAWQDPYTEALVIDTLPSNEVQANRIEKYMLKNELTELKGQDYENANRAYYQQQHPYPTWYLAALERYEQDEKSHFQKTTDSLFKKSQHKRIIKGKISMRKAVDANTKCNGPFKHILSVSPHPKANITAVTTKDKHIRIYHVDGIENPLMESINLGQNIKASYFSPEGKGIYAMVDAPMLMYRDLPTSKTTTIMLGDGKSRWSHFAQASTFYTLADAQSNAFHIVSKRSNHIIRTLNTPERITSIQFHPKKEHYVFTTTAKGHITLWDVRQQKTLYQMKDYGVIDTLSMAISPSYLTTGNVSGTVNIYNLADVEVGNEPKPIKTLQNLVTPIDMLTFNHDEQLLGIGSSYKENAYRIVHLPSCQVYENFPLVTSRKTARASCMSFAHNSEYFYLGSGASVRTYQLHHYTE